MLITWTLLFTAAAFEVVWAIALKRSEGFSHLGYSLLFGAALLLSMALLAQALRELPVGTAYAVWTGTGAVGAALAGVVLLGEPASAARLLPIGLIAVGIVWLALGE